MEVHVVSNTTQFLCFRILIFLLLKLIASASQGKNYETAQRIYHRPIAVHRYTTIFSYLSILTGHRSMAAARQEQRSISCLILTDLRTSTTCFPLPGRCLLIAVSGRYLVTIPSMDCGRHLFPNLDMWIDIFIWHFIYIDTKKITILAILHAVFY